MSQAPADRLPAARAERRQRRATTGPRSATPATVEAATTQAVVDLLRRRQAVSEEKLHDAEAHAAREDRSLLEALLDRSAVEPSALLTALEEVHEVPAVDLTRVAGDPYALDLLPRDVAFELEAVPLWAVGRQLTVALADPANLQKLDELRFVTGCEILPCVVLADDLRRHLVRSYGELDSGGVDDVLFEAVDEPDHGEASSLRLEAEETERPVVRLVNRILLRAIEDGASDVHLEPGERQLAVRSRVDGLLRAEPYRIPASRAPAVVSRIKILARMDIAEHRVPQDGKLRVRAGGRSVDVRVSCFPTIRGEKLVLRLLDGERSDFRLDQLGMSPAIRDAWVRLIRRHEGIVLVTGPTGSGKSSTLYATLRYLHRPEVNIVTFEDPVEYEITGVSQAQVNDRAGFTFSRGLRSILRQDPDIVLLGEIRDAESAEVAVQAALTGHLVLSTLHTNDAPSAVTRLLHLGVDASLVSASLVGVLAQRLVRRLCPECVRDVEPTDEERLVLRGWLDASDLRFRDGEGCAACCGAGYQGRLPVQEVLEVTPEVRVPISRAASAMAIAEAARVTGYRRMWHDGLDRVRRGLTSLRELARVVEQDDAPPPGAPPASAGG